MGRGTKSEWAGDVRETGKGEWILSRWKGREERVENKEGERSTEGDVGGGDGRV